MNIKLNTLCLGGFLALGAFLAQPVMADEWNKKTEFQFSAPVQIPGHVLAPGKYVFQITDSESDRNIVQVFSEDSNGKDTLIATLLAIPDHVAETPDKATVQLEERQSGTPEAIRSWFYPGDNTGWQFIYPKGETTHTAANTPPVAAAAVTAGATPSLPAAPQIQVVEPTTDEDAAVAEEVMIAQNEVPERPAAPAADAQHGSYAPMLPETGGYSGLELVTGLAMLAGGIVAVSGSRRKSQA